MSTRAAISLAIISWALMIMGATFFISTSRHELRSAQVSRAWDCETRGGVPVRADVDGTLSVVVCLNKEAIK